MVDAFFKPAVINLVLAAFLVCPFIFLAEDAQLEEENLVKCQPIVGFLEIGVIFGKMDLF